MKFTKEQKEIINEMYNLQLDGSDFGARIRKAFAEVLKPETKKIVVKIECNYPKEFPLDEHSIRAILNCGCSESGLDWKVTELPEVFSREDIDKIFDSKFSDNDYVDSFINKLLSERSKNDN